MAAGFELESIFHFSVTASDFERSLAFYLTLGFRLLRDNRDVVWPEYVARQLGLAEAQGRGALLALGEEAHHTRLDLIEWLAPRHPDPAASIPLERRIPRIIALRTRNVRAAWRELSARGIEFIGEPRGPDADTGIEAVVCCRDPDGLVVELIEYQPGVLGSRIDKLARRESKAAKRPRSEAQPSEVRLRAPARETRRAVAPSGSRGTRSRRCPRS